MVRPKEFDRDQALLAAIGAFAEQGYEATSTERLLRAMGISRQSLYDTFGDKRRLYLEALQRYNADSVAELILALNTGAAAPLKNLEAALLALAAKWAAQPAIGCMGVTAICEFGRADPEVAALGDMAGRTLLSALERLLSDAKAAGALGAEVEPRMAAQFVAATLSGMRVAARGGAPVATLRGIARMAVRSLG
jgi:AcrR family transcriptional regulator